MILSDREKEILTLLIKGFSNNEIHKTLWIEEMTVKKHIYHIHKKLNVKSTRELLCKFINGIENVEININKFINVL